MRHFVAVSATLLSVLLVSPAIAQDGQPSPHHTVSQANETDNGTQHLPLIGMQIVIAGWIFVLGACFGSFLNVVIYRLPAGMSLGKPKSRCPRCETQLAVKDNIPVLGWLLLRGKCRYCDLPISPRYPIVEAVCGGVFLLLLFTELLSGAANLPLRHPDHFHVNPGFWLVWFTKWDLSGIYLYHCCLLVVVLAIVMIGYDGHRPQRSLTAFGVLTALIAGVFFSELRPVPALPWTSRMADLQWGFWWRDSIINPGSRYWAGVSLVGLLDGVIGLLVGHLAGCLIRWQMRSPEDSSASPQQAAIGSAMMVTGAFLGWQACGMLLLFVLPAMAGVKWIENLKPESRLPQLIAPAFFGLLLAFIVFWQKLNDAPWMIGYQGWDLTSWNWIPDWLATWAAMSAFGTLVRYGIRKKPDSNELHWKF